MGALKMIVRLSFLLIFLSAQMSLAHESFVDVIVESKSSIVIVEATRSKKVSKQKSKEAIEALGDNADFFRDDLNELQKLSNKSNGSGFIVKYDKFPSTSKFILTAGHVVLGASRVKVLLNNRRRNAKVLWLDRRNDIALLEIDVSTSEKLPEGLSLTSDTVLEGQPILSIASSFAGLPISSSQGIVSAVDVSLPNKKKLKLIQTDAAINPGSSGGPLLDNKAKVVGVISSIYTQTGTFSGAAFAIPSAKVMDLIEKNIKNMPGR